MLLKITSLYYKPLINKPFDNQHYTSQPIVRTRNAKTEKMLEVSQMIALHFSADDENGDSFEDANSDRQEPAVAVNGGAAPPPPPPPPPPRPGYWRFPEAEFANKVWHR